MTRLDESPIVPVVAALLADGFAFRLGPLDVVQIRPSSKVPPDAVALFRAHGDALRVLVGVLTCDAGLEQRLRVFESQASGPFTLASDAVVSVGACPSCTEVLEPWAAGRCWRCRVAMQIVCGGPITAAGRASVASAA